VDTTYKMAVLAQGPPSSMGTVALAENGGFVFTAG
jgi:hypothetical protein